MKIYSLLILALFMISIVSANGLVIVGENSFSTEKNEDVNTEFRIVIQNQETFTFYNITLEGEGLAKMPEIPVLNSGESANVTITINSDEDFNGTLTIIGEYEAQLGASNKTELVEVSYEDGINKCDLSLIKGDSVNWKNTGLDKIKLKDVTTGEYFIELEDGENETRLFSEPITLEYVGVWIVPFTEICKIEVVDDQGLIHSSEYDASVSLNLSVIYEQTTIQTTFLSTSYSLDYNQIKTDEYFSIKNTGDKTARMKLSSDWITFDKNELNLGIGESINIGYTISPMITNTNSTNKTHVKTIKIEGNFETIENNISIYIKYSNIDDIINTGEVNYDFWLNAFRLLCLNYEESGDQKLKEICEKNQNNYNGSLGSGFEFTPESSYLFLETYGEDKIEQSQYRTSDLEFKSNVSDILSKMDERLGTVENETSESNKTNKNSSMVALVFLSIIAGVILLVVLYFLIMRQIRNNGSRKKLGLTETEYND